MEVHVEVQCEACGEQPEGLRVCTAEDLLVEIDVFAVFMGFNQLLDDISDGHHHQLGSAEVT